MKILALGDVVGSESTEYLALRLRSFIRKNGIDFTLVNGENSAKHNGIDAFSADMLLNAGADVITTGNHVYRIDGFKDYLDESRFVIRPANYPSACAGRGYTVLDCGFKRILVMNALGQINTTNVDSPFDAIDRILDTEKGNYDISLLDIHAEATSEKAAVARYFDGRITAVFGTHTHVQTNDARILPKGTAFITDLGMCGPENSILGVESDIIINRLRLHSTERFEYATGNIEAQGVVFNLDGNTVTDLSTVKF